MPHSTFRKRGPKNVSEVVARLKGLGDPRTPAPTADCNFGCSIAGLLMGIVFDLLLVIGWGQLGRAPEILHGDFDFL